MSDTPTSAKPLALTWLALLLLLALTLGSAYIPLNGFNAAVNLAIAVAKALLVLFVFMHLRHASSAIKLIAPAGFFWLALLIGLALADFTTR